MQQIQPFLMFKHNAEEAAKFYISIFKNSHILNTTYWTEREIENLQHVPEAERPGPVGTVKSISFVLNGQRFDACNGGDHFTFSQGISLYVNCDTQEEIDHLYTKLAEQGGQQQDCGWVTDKFGVSWQIAPTFLMEAIQDPDSIRASKVSSALYKMKKIDISALKLAYGASDTKRPKPYTSSTIGLY